MARALTSRKTTRSVKKKPATRRASTKSADRTEVPPAVERKVEVTPAEVLASARASLQEQLAKVWAQATKVHAEGVDGVTLHVALFSGATPHWHLVTDGLALAGFELSLRVPAQPDETEPSGWAADLMRHVIASSRAGQLGSTQGQVVTLARSIGLEESHMQSITFGTDPVLKPLNTVPVRVVFGLMRDEARLTREWSPDGLLDVARLSNPLLMTDPERPSLLLSPRARAAIEQRVEREGSAMEGFATRISELKQTNTQTTWKLSSDAVETVVSLLKGRIAHQRPFSVKAGRGIVEVTPVDGHASGTTPHVLKLSQTAARQMRATLKAKPGTYQWEALPNFTIEIVN